MIESPFEAPRHRLAERPLPEMNISIGEEQPLARRLLGALMQRVDLPEPAAG